MTATTDLETVLRRAEAAPAVVAVGTEGSLNDAAVATDAWADLDVTIFTTAPVDGFAWVQALGTPVIYQHLANRDLFGESSAIWDTWLVRYEGTRRIDWKFAPRADVDAYLAADSLNTLVWQRDAALTPRPTSAISHAVVAPTQAAYDDCVNELLWCAGNVAKGLHRQNLVYANEMLNAHVRPELLQLLAWQALSQRPGFDAGASDKFLAAALPEAQASQLAATYAQGDVAQATASLARVLVLSESASAAVAQGFGLKPPAYVQQALAQLRSWL